MDADWLEKLGYVEFLRDYGVHFTINRMLTFDSVKLRLEREQPLTFLEFNYMLMQAVDFLELNRRHACVMQMGGSDQWGNIINGVELIRRIDAKPAFALTSPLITTASGAKMGKTAAGAVWLNADRLSPYDYWQFWRNTEDADVGRFMKLFTDLPLEEIARLEAMEGAGINEAKIKLATEATAMVHGREAARPAVSARLASGTPASSSAWATSTVGRSAETWPCSKVVWAVARAVAAASGPCSRAQAASASAFLASLIPAPSRASRRAISSRGRSVNSFRNFPTSPSSVFLQNCQ